VTIYDECLLKGFIGQFNGMTMQHDNPFQIRHVGDSVDAISKKDNQDIKNHGKSHPETSPD